MEVFIRGEQYLVLVENIDSVWSRFMCRVCGSFKTIRYKRVESGHDKTCGCMNGTSKLELSLTIDGYAVTNTGIAIQSKMANGYLGIRGKYLHRMIAEHFIPNTQGFTDVNHIDGNKHNNSVSNLEWCTRSHNIKHAWYTGLNNGVRGQKSDKRTLSDNDISYIRTSGVPSREIAKEFGVSKTTILNIRNNKIYKN